MPASPPDLLRWIPGVRVLRTYRRAWLAKDIGAGLALTAILVPTGMGYAAAAGLPVIHGLYATIVPLVAYAIFGPSRILVLGPDSALVALIAATILPVTDVDITAADALAELDRELHEAGMDLCFAEMKGPVKDRLKRYGLFTTLGTENFFPTIGQAVDGYLAAHRVEWHDWDERPAQPRPDQRAPRD